ncbi:MAG TPA: four helix bundle protein [Thermomicrobiales bacterium]|nr:four helix bundle protein [Thermomicrobiales bacterium]
MSKVPSHRDLIVWQKAMDLVVLVYELATMLPPGERYGMKSQMTRAAVSVPANIAEGKGRGTQREYVHFLRIARGSLMELDTYIELVDRLGYADSIVTAPIRALIVQIGKMLSAVRTRLSIPLPSDPPNT